MVVWIFEVNEDCDFAGIPLLRGMLLVVRPGHPTRPMTAQVELPPNYGMLLNLMADESITAREPFAPAAFAALPPVLAPDPQSPRERPRRRRHLRLVR